MAPLQPLSRLYDDEIVGMTADGYYHALSDREDIRRYVANLDQAHRMFGHHRERDAPDEPDEQIGASRRDDELEAELESLEDDLEE